MIVKCNITGIPSIRLKVSSKLTQQLHVNRKTDKFGRRVSTSWVTCNTEVLLSRYHDNKNSKDVDGLIYVGRAFQQYMDKFDQEFGFRLAGVRAFAKFFETHGKSHESAFALAEYVMDVIVANKDKATILVTFDASGKKMVDTSGEMAVAADAAPEKAKKLAWKVKTSESESSKSSIAHKKRGRPRKMYS